MNLPEEMAQIVLDPWPNGNQSGWQPKFGRLKEFAPRLKAGTEFATDTKEWSGCRLLLISIVFLIWRGQKWRQLIGGEPGLLVLGALMGGLLQIWIHRRWVHFRDLWLLNLNWRWNWWISLGSGLFLWTVVTDVRLLLLFWWPFLFTAKWIYKKYNNIIFLYGILLNASIQRGIGKGEIINNFCIFSRIHSAFIHLFCLQAYFPYANQWIGSHWKWI